MNNVSDSEREKIKKEAKQILDNFSKALGKGELKEKRLSGESRGFRIEGKPLKIDDSFRKIMFENAKNKDSDYIITEVKQW